MINRPIESYIKEIRRVLGDGETIYLDETFTRKLRTILEEIESKFKVRDMDIFKYKKGNKVKFQDIKDKHCFYRGSVLYKKILEQDLAEYGITAINAISIIKGV